MNLASKAEDREVRDLLSLVEEVGWNLKRTTNGHFKIYPPGEQMVYMAGKVGDPAGFKNAVARLKRAGLFAAVEEKRGKNREQPVEEDEVLARLEEVMNQTDPEEKSTVDEHTIRLIQLGRMIEQIHSTDNIDGQLKKVVELLKEADKLGVTMLEVAAALQKK